MRATFWLVGSLALFLGACSSRGGHAPPPLNKEWLSGKWKNVATTQILTDYDFNDGGTVKMKFRGIKEPITGRYTWSGERTVEVAFPTEADVRQAYEAAAKAYKQEVKEKIDSKELSDKAGPSMLGMVPDKLPDKETFTVGITDPKYLVLVRQDNATLNFEKVD